MKGLPLSLLIGLRFSRGRRRSGMVSLISIISTMGIALGVAVLIVGLSAMNGFERELRDRILSVVPHAEIEPVVQPFSGWRTTIERLRQSPDVLGAAPYATFTGLVESGTKLRAIQIRGVDPEQEQQISGLPNFVMDNAWQDFNAGEQQIIIGKGLAEQIDVKMGDWVTVMIPNNDGNSAMQIAQPKRIRLQVAGILDLVGDLGYSFGLIPLSDAQRYLDMGDGVTGIALKVKDLFNANRVVVDVGNSYYNGPEAYTRSWVSNYGRMYRDIQMIRTIMYLAMVLVIGVACFNIVSTLVMAVKDKSGDIAVLRTLGAKDGLIRAIFIWYGLMAGFIGSVVGVIIGVTASLQLTAIIRVIETAFDHHFLSAGIYFVDFLPSELHWLDVAIVLLTALLLSLAASWYPAQRACRINPARVLSGQ